MNYTKKELFKVYKFELGLLAFWLVLILLALIIRL